VIATMRSDFFQRLPDVPLLLTVSAGDARYLLGFPDAAALAQIIQQPAVEAGLRFETDGTSGLNLAQVLQQEAAESPDALPLLEFALDQLWQRRTDRGEMTFAAYNQLGGLKGAIGSRAEEEFLKQPADVRAALPVVLRALATSAPSADVTARPAPLARFPPGTPARRLIDALLSPTARLLVADGDGTSARVRVAHEALLTHWERARKQLATDRADLQTRTRLEQATARWREDRTASRSTLLLNPGAPLVEAEDLLRRTPDALDPTVVAFITSSSAAARRSRRRLQIAAVSFAIIALIAGIAAWQAYAAANLARSRELAAEAEQQIETNPELAVLLGTAALDARDTPRAESALRDALQRVQRFTLTGHSDRVRRAVFSPDGRSLVTASRDGDARIFDTTNGTQVKVLSAHAGPVHDAVYTTDGRNVLTAGEDGIVRVWDAASGSLLRELRGHEGAVYSVAAAPEVNIVTSGGKDGTVRIWNLAAETPPKVIATWQRDEARAINCVVFSPDGTRVLAAGENFDAMVWNVADGRLIVRLPHTGYVVSAAFSPNGQLIATASGEFVHVWGIDGAESSPQLRCAGLCGAVGFDTTGEHLAVGTESGRTDIYRTGGVTIERQLIGRGFVRSAVFSRGGVVATAGDDATVRIWTADGPVQTFADHAAEVANAAFSPDGRLVVTASGEQVSIWDVVTGKRRSVFNADARDVISALFSPDGRFIVTAGDDGSAGVWTSDGALYRALPGHTTTVNSASFSADSKQIVTSSKDGHVRLFNAETGALVREFPSEGGEARAAVFSPDGRFAAAGHSDGTVRVWNTADGSASRRITSDDSPIYGVAFSPDGTSIATATLNGSVRLWDIVTGKLIGEFKLAGLVVSVEFSNDGRFVVAAGRNTASVWEVRTGHVVMTVSSGSGIRGAAFRPDGRAIITADVDHTARVFACDACVSGPELKALAKERVKRGFTNEERALHPGADSMSRMWIRALTRQPRRNLP